MIWYWLVTSNQISRNVTTPLENQTAFTNLMDLKDKYSGGRGEVYMHSIYWQVEA